MYYICLEKCNKFCLQNNNSVFTYDKYMKLLKMKGEKTLNLWIFQHHDESEPEWLYFLHITNSGRATS